MNSISESQAQMLANMEAMRQHANSGTTQSPSSDKQSGFGALLQEALGHVNQNQMKADELQQGYLNGKEGVDLVETVLATQQASIKFQTTQQIRNKLLAAFREIMNQQI